MKFWPDDASVLWLPALEFTNTVLRDWTTLVMVIP